jgi:hypothetical protein
MGEPETMRTIFDCMAKDGTDSRPGAGKFSPLSLAAGWLKRLRSLFGGAGYRPERRYMRGTR